MKDELRGWYAIQKKPELICVAGYGRMECLRMLFKYSEIEYTETPMEEAHLVEGKIFSMEIWNQIETGQVPVVEENGN